MVWKKKQIGKELAKQLEEVNDEQEVEEEYDEVEEVAQQPVKRKVVPLKQIEEVEKESTWDIGEIPTQTSLVIVNKKTKESYSLYQAVALLLERTED